MIVTHAHGKAIELIKRRIVSHWQACKQTPCRQHHTHPDSRCLKPTSIECLPCSRHLVVTLIDSHKGPIEELRQHPICPYENLCNIEFAIIYLVRLESRKYCAVFRLFGQPALNLDMRRQHIERSTRCLIFWKSRIGWKPKLAISITDDRKHLGDFPRNQINLADRLCARMFDNRGHIPGQFSIRNAYRRQIDTKCLGGRRLQRGLVGIRRPQYRATDIPSMPSQSQIDTILSSKLKDGVAIQKGICQIHRSIASARLEQNACRAHNELWTNFRNHFS